MPQRTYKKLQSLRNDQGNDQVAAPETIRSRIDLWLQVFKEQAPLSWQLPQLGTYVLGPGEV
jgi:hypothetical protein